MHIDAERMCGLSHDNLIQFFSKSINKFISENESQKTSILCIANEYGYLNLNDAQIQIENHNNGICRHGLDYNCCPAGCGEY